MNVKYQIFLSSTFEDLKDERQQVVKAILEMGHIPVGMEMFSAGDEEQWELIARAIDQSDYYVVIVAHRYGSTTENGLGYTEKEYDYAVRTGVPVLGFVIDKSAPWPADKMESDKQKAAALERFRLKVREKHVAFWKDGRDLYGQAAIALGKQIHSRPQPGWVPATEAASPAVTEEMSRLSKENADLRKRIAQFESVKEPLEITENRPLIDTMKSISLAIPVIENGAESSEQVSLLDLFSQVAPSFTTENTSMDPFTRGAARCLDLAEADISSAFDARDIVRNLHTLGLFDSVLNLDRGTLWKLSEKGRELLRGLTLQQQSVPTIDTSSPISKMFAGLPKRRVSYEE